ncbi:MAG: hypothetical protein R3E02_04855 [Blastomonas sp.]
MAAVSSALFAGAIRAMNDAGIQAMARRCKGLDGRTASGNRLLNSKGEMPGSAMLIGDSNSGEFAHGLALLPGLGMCIFRRSRAIHGLNAGEYRKQGEQKAQISSSIRAVNPVQPVAHRH